MNQPRALALLILLTMPACTVVKPVVCTFSYPITNLRIRLAMPDDESKAHEEIPPTLALIAAPVLVPLRFTCDAVMGFAGGLVSGFASDLNVLTWNFDEPARNLTRPFRTNAKRPRD